MVALTFRGAAIGLSENRFDFISIEIAQSSTGGALGVLQTEFLMSCAGSPRIETASTVNLLRRHNHPPVLSTMAEIPCHESLSSSRHPLVVETEKPRQSVSQRR